MKTNEQLTPAEVKAMPLKEFEQRFGFRPESAAEQHYFAGMGSRPDALTLRMLAAGVMGPIEETSLARAND